MIEKMKSRRWWIVIWALAYISIVSIICIKTGYDAGWISGTMAVVAGIPVTYVTFSTIKKKD
jgi:hypothetical protein